MDLFLNQLQLGAYVLIEGMIYAAGGILSAILSVLSVSTYRTTGLPKVKYAIGAFALLSAFLFYEYLEIFSCVSFSRNANQYLIQVSTLLQMIPLRSLDWQYLSYRHTQNQQVCFFLYSRYYCRMRLAQP